jgi:hypothetical protein
LAVFFLLMKSLIRAGWMLKQKNDSDDEE